MVMEALNIATDGFEAVAHIEHAGDEYILHKPRKPPFQQAYFKSRCLWVHKTAGYIVWMGTSKDVLMCHSNIADSPEDIGEKINQYRYDKAVYAQLKAQHRAGNSGAAVTTTTVTTTSRKVVTKTVTTKVEAGSSRSVPPEVKDGSIVLPKKMRVLPPSKAQSKLSTAAAVASTGDALPQHVVASEADAADVVAQTEDVAPAHDAAPAQDVSPAQDVTPAQAAAESSDAALFYKAIEDAKASPKATAKAAAEAALKCDEVVEDDDAMVEEDKENDDKSDTLAALQAELEEQRKRADAAEKEAAHERRKHKQYIQTKAREKKRTDSELQDVLEKLRDAPSKEEHERTKQELNKTLAMLPASADEQAAALKSHPKSCYLELVQLCRTALDAAINSASATVAPSASATTTGTFEYIDNAGHWAAITDASVNGALTKLMKDGGKVTYSFAGHTYEASRNTTADTSYDIAQTNMNPQFLTVRRIRDPALHAADATSLSKENAHEILFGRDSWIELTPEFINSMLSEYRFNVGQSYEMCLPLAELAETFSSLGSGFKYTMPAGTSPSGKAKYHVSYSESGKDHNSELFVKPIALFQWLSVAKSRGYSSARLVMHGSSKAGYEKIRADLLGFDMEFAGKHGQAYGNGLYFGLSDHATKNYNAGYPDGTCIIAILLTNKKNGWQHHHHGGYTLAHDESVPHDDFVGRQYKTMNFASPVKGMDNAIVVHEPPLLLPLGFVNAWSEEKGWLM